MYKLEGSLCLRRGLGSNWEEVDLTGVQLFKAFQEYRQFYLILSHPSQTAHIYANMADVIVGPDELNMPVGVWLDHIENRTLPMVSELPTANKRSVRYGNIEQLAYNVRLAEAGLHLAPNVPPTTLNDLALTRLNMQTDMRMVEQNCLVTVNGYLHYAVADNYTAYVIGGGKTAKAQKAYTFGLLSFGDLGTNKIIRGDNLTISAFDRDGGTVYEKTRISINEEIGNRAYFAVIGGYIVLPKDGVFQQVSDTDFMLDLSRLPYEERLIESRDALGLDALHPDLTARFEGMNIDVARTDDFIRAYMKLPQSFIVLIDCPSIQIEKKHIQRASFPGQYLVTEFPTLPLVGPYGRLLDYWTNEENKMWSLEVYNNYHNQYVFTEGPRRRAQFASNAVDGTRHYKIAEAYFLDISTTKE